MWNPLKKVKKTEEFKDDEQFVKVYKMLSESDIQFNTVDNKYFNANVENKLWISIFYSDNVFSKDITMNSYIRVITDPDPVGKIVGMVSIELNFNKDNMKKINKLLDLKINNFRYNTTELDKIEAERQEKINNILNS